jgi:hypothetical protein
MRWTQSLIRGCDDPQAIQHGSSVVAICVRGDSSGVTPGRNGQLPGLAEVASSESAKKRRIYRCTPCRRAQPLLVSHASGSVWRMSTIPIRVARFGASRIDRMSGWRGEQQMPAASFHDFAERGHPAAKSAICSNIIDGAPMKSLSGGQVAQVP